MDKSNHHSVDNPGDCQTAVADSTTIRTAATTTTPTRTTRATTAAAANSYERHFNETPAAPTTTTAAKGTTKSNNNAEDVQVSSTTTTTINLAESKHESTGASATSVAAAASTSTSASVSTKPNSSPPAGNKIKSQQQQQQPTQQQQQQHYQHQFRAPQQFVKHKKSTSSLQQNKKNKTWNKRQNKLGKPTNNVGSVGGGGGGGLLTGLTHAGGHTIGAGGNNVAGGGGGSVSAAVNSLTAANITKADLENIQNLRNQPGGYHFYHRGGGGGPGGGGVAIEGRIANTNNNGLPPSLHLKQQLYKKMLAHRGHHHHHVLCAGAAHNSLGGGGGGVGSANLNCCHPNGCSSHNGKEAVNGGAIGGGGGGSIGGAIGAGNTNVNAAGNAPCYCCLRSKFFLPDKRPRKEVIIPPTKFLLGGNISDPLNLNSLQNETSNASANTTPATTPRQSPITTPPKVEVIIPPNIHDPLHLLDPVDSMEYEKQLTSPMKRVGCIGSKLALGLHGLGKPHHKSHHRHRKNRKPKRRRHDSYNSNATANNNNNSSNAADLDDTCSLANSTISTGDASSTTLSLSNIENSNSSFNNALLASTVSSTHTQQETMPTSGEERSEYFVAEGGSPNKRERLERNKSLLAISPTQAAGAAAEKSTISQQQHVISTTEVGQQTIAAAGGGVVVSGIESNVVATGEMLARERTKRDLRLELTTTTLSTNATAAGTTAATATGSTCGNIVGGGGAGGGGVGAGGGRKRKISESNNSQKSKKFPRYEAMDKIVSPVVPQPGAWKRPPRLAASGARKPVTRRSRSVSENETLSPVDESVKSLTFNEDSTREGTPDLSKVDTISESGLGSPLSTISAATSLAAGEQDGLPEASNKTEHSMAPPSLSTAVPQSADSDLLKLKASQALVRLTKMPKFSVDGAKYRYGNYNRYHGYRTLNEFMDVRLQVFQNHVDLFQNKDILDIGCNSGHMTLTVARHFAPKSILGIDIDKDLIGRARRNLALYVRIPVDTKLPLKSTAAPAEPTNSDAKNATSVPSVKTEAVEVIKTETEIENPKKGRRRKRVKRKSAASFYQQHLQQQHLQQHQQFFHHHHHHYHHYYHQHLQKQQQLKELHVDASELFPVSFPLSYGSIPPTTTATSNESTTTPTTVQPSANNTNAATATTSSGTIPANTTPTSSSPNAASASPPTKRTNDFPRNVFFRHLNYVLKDEALLANDTQQYDVILCLSVTKWIHLNFGDAGLKLAFKRMFNQLRPGGKLILEAQNWASYKKKKNLTEDIYNNYRQIELFPNKFHEYLLSSEVGFSHSYTLGVPRHLNKGFSRPIQLYAKGDYTPNHVRWSDAYYPQTPYEAYRGIYATMPPRPPALIYPWSSTRSQTYDTPHYTGSASGSYSCRQTPMHQPTSQYYNPLETDSYQPSYDLEYLNHMYVFASPLYQTVWSPPASMRRNSSTHTPIFGSVRDAEYDGDGSAGLGGGGSYHRHVYPPNDDTMSPNANAGNAFNSIRDPDTDDSNQLPAGSRQHVYATNCGESSSSPQVNHHDAENIEESLMLDDEQHAAGELHEV